MRNLLLSVSSTCRVVTCLLLFVWKIEGIAPRLDAAIRLFLTGFVAFHMTTNYRANAKRVLARELEQQAADDESEVPLGALDGSAGPAGVASEAGSELGDDIQDL